MEESGKPTRLYRIVSGNPPTRDDFLSDRARGKNPPLRPEQARYHDGFSSYRSLAQARKKARAIPALGQFIAAFAVPYAQGVNCERSLRNSPGHFTVYGDPDVLAQNVLALYAVDEDDEQEEDDDV